MINHCYNLSIEFSLVIHHTPMSFEGNHMTIARNWFFLGNFSTCAWFGHLENLCIIYFYFVLAPFCGNGSGYLFRVCVQRTIWEAHFFLLCCSEFEELDDPLEPSSSSASNVADVPDDRSFVNFFSVFPPSLIIWL